VKTAISVHSNRRLSVADRLGRKGCSYLAQASKQLVTKKYVEGIFPEVCAKSYEVKRKRGRDNIQQRIVKQEKCNLHVTLTCAPAASLKRVGRCRSRWSVSRSEISKVLKILRF
jgi:hypothetical protein